MDEQFKININNTRQLLSLKSRITKPGIALYGGTHVMLRVQLLFNTIAIYKNLRIQLRSYSIRRLPHNIAIRLTIFKGNHRRYDMGFAAYEERVCRKRIHHQSFLSFVFTFVFISKYTLTVGKKSYQSK